MKSSISKERRGCSSKLLLLVFTLGLISTKSPGQWVASGSLNAPGVFPRICVADSNVVWVCGGSGVTPKIWRTVNGGANWTSINTTGVPFWLFTIYAKDSLNAFVGDAGSSGYSGGNCHLFKTTNGGANWILVDTTGGTQAWISGITFSKINPNFGFAISDPPNGPGAPFYFAKTTNGGVTWTRDFLAGVYNTLTLGDGSFCVDSSFYGFLIIESDYVDSTRVYYTNNGGVNWYIRGTTPSFGSDLGGFCDFNSNKTHGIFINSGMLPNIARTTDGGSTWNIVNSGVSGTGNPVIKWITGTNIVFVTSQSSSTANYVFRSNDNGTTWNAQITPSGMQNIIDAGFVRNGSLIHGYVLTTNGNIFRTIQDTMLIGIHSISNRIPTGFALFQNYPNPFNPSTKIRFEVPVSTHIMLNVYDVLGRQVATLVNEYLVEGVYEVSWNPAGFSSGVYFYRLTSAAFTDTKKMILSK